MSRIARVVAVSLLMLLAACTSSSPSEPSGGTAPETTLASADPTTGPTETSEPPDGGDDPQPVAPIGEIDWQQCGSLECGTLAVPLDHDDPTGPTIDIAVTKRATNSSARIGSIFLNFGGPGGESGEILQSAGLFYGSLFGDSFDIVVWDPRGVGESERLACDDAGVDNVGVGAVDPSDGFQSELDVETESFGVIADCAAATGPIIDHLSTSDVARDLDILRQAVGDDGLTYLGFSYGTQIGWVYATLFPENVRALVLDGAVPPGSLTAQGLLDQYASFERTFEAFEASCQSDPACLARNEGLGVRIDRLIEELEAQPVPIAGGGVFGPEDLLEGVASLLYADASVTRPQLDGALDALDRGDPSAFVTNAARSSGSSTPGAYKAVTCADGFDVDSDADSIEQMTNMIEVAPLFGRLNEGIRCDLWPGEVEGLPELDTAGAPTILVVGSTLDPATPYESAVELDSVLDDSVLLTYEGTGHTIVGSDACINGHVIDYVANLVVPPAETVC